MGILKFDLHWFENSIQDKTKIFFFGKQKCYYAPKFNC